MVKMIDRQAKEYVLQLLETFPAVVIVGPRQVGKTTLAKQIAAEVSGPTSYLDLELPSDLARMTEPEIYLAALVDSLVILDEVQRLPDLFPILRSLIDQNRKPGRFLLLGSASPELIRDTSESLAGRVAYYELKPLQFAEVSDTYDYQSHWLRGGFPEALLASSEKKSFRWRQQFVRSYLERDLALLGLGADPMMLRRLWMMVAHINGGVLNVQNLSRSLGISGPIVAKYLDFFEAAFLIRRLPAFYINLGKRLIKSPKIYVRDTGILHSLLNIQSTEELLGHISVGGSWESYVLNEVFASLPDGYEMFFYRSRQGTEVDIVIASAGKPDTLIEIKLSLTPTISRGFRIAMEDLQTTRNYIVCPVQEKYPISKDVTVIGLADLPDIYDSMPTSSKPS